MKYPIYITVALTATAVTLAFCIHDQFRIAVLISWTIAIAVSIVLTILSCYAKAGKC